LNVNGWAAPYFENPATTQGAGMGLAIAPEFGDHDVIGHRSTIKHFSARVALKSYFVS
jgi:hypothetical protein